MPVGEYIPTQPWEIDPALWERLNCQVAALMLAAGWVKSAKKFDQVKKKKAMNLWRHSRHRQ